MPTSYCDGIEERACVVCGEKCYMSIPALGVPLEDVEMIKECEPAHNPKIAGTLCAHLVQIFTDFFQFFGIDF